MQEDGAVNCVVEVVGLHTYVSRSTQADYILSKKQYELSPQTGMDYSRSEILQVN